MKTDKFGQQIYTEQDLVDILMEGKNLSSMPHLVDSPIDLKPIRWLVDNPPNISSYIDPQITVEEFDQLNQSNWLMPEKYKQLDVVAYVLDMCNDQAELQRAGEELLLFAEKDMLELLRYLVYLVDTMQQNDVVWGVGRGSSVASFVLYKIGIHRINSLYYDLDIKEFLR